MAIKCPECHTENTADSQFCKQCATPLPAPEGISVTKTLEIHEKKLSKGTIFADRYEVLAELGTGGMGEVYKVRDKKLDEVMALKLLKAEIAADKGIIQRFKNELKLARKIGHRNVCRMYDLNEEEASPYITMEYVEGDNLKVHIKRKEKLSQEEAISLAKQVCKGLREAHVLGVVHRDLKPQNIMVDAQGDAKIMDFGIARSLEAPGVTKAGVIIGTPDYISPEQAEGEEADQRSDIYSLGVILYEMVTGQLPFQGDTAFSVALKHKTRLPADPKKLNPEISDNLSRLILVCMEKGRERRYQTAEALLSDLRNVEEGFPLGTKVRPRRETFLAALLRRKLFVPAVVLLLAVTAVLVWQWTLRSPGPVSLTSERPSVAILYFKNNTGDPSLDYLSETLPALMTIDLMQSKYLYVLPSDRLIQVLNRLELQERGDYSTDELEKIADWGVVDHIIQGRYFKSGDDFRVFLQIQKRGSWEVIGSETLSGKVELHARMVDELTPRIKSYFDLTEQDISGDIDFDIGQITTQSPEAFTYFNQGMKYFGLRDWESALQSFKRAVDVDPQFAMAHVLLGWMYRLTQLYAEAQGHLGKASSLTGRLTDRERYFVQAFVSLFEGDEGRTIESLEKILELYPDDWLTNYLLGETYLTIEEWEKARALFLRNRRNKVDFADNYVKLAITYKYEGLYDEAIEVCRYCIENFSEIEYIRYEIAQAYLCKGQLDMALEEINKAQSQFPFTSFYYGALIWVKGNILMFMEDWLNAEKEYRRMLDSQRSRTWPGYGFQRLGYIFETQGRLKESLEMFKQGLRDAESKDLFRWQLGFHGDLAHAYLQTGNLAEALIEVEKAIELAETYSGQKMQVRAQFLKGEIHLGMGSIEEAQKTADEIKIMVENGLNKKLIRYYYLLKGLIEFKRNNFEEAKEYQMQALSLLPFQVPVSESIVDLAVFYEAMAKTYLKLEELDKGQESLEKIVSFTDGRLNHGVIYAKAFYVLGKIHEQMGGQAKAVEHYQKFLDLWKDADPGFPEVEDAKIRLLGLKD